MGGGETLKKLPDLLYGGRRHVDGQRSALSSHPPASTPLLSAFLSPKLLLSDVIPAAKHLVYHLYIVPFLQLSLEIPQSRLWSVFSIMVCPTGRRRRVIVGVLRMERWSPGITVPRSKFKERATQRG